MYRKEVISDGNQHRISPENTTFSRCLSASDALLDGWPDCGAQIKCGEDLTFGPLTISWQELCKGADRVPWQQISQVHIFAGIVAIAKDGIPQKWPLVKVARIPNFFLFIALVYLLTDGRVSYAPLEFARRDYFWELMQFLFRKKKISDEYK